MLAEIKVELSSNQLINREQITLPKQPLISAIDLKIATVVGDLQHQLETKHGDYQQLMENVKILENRVEELKSIQNDELAIVTSNLEKLKLLSKQSEAEVRAVEERINKQQNIKVKHKLSEETLKDPSKINSIATSLLHGRGVTKDSEQAFDFYLVAAEKGYAPAMLNVSRIYLDKESPKKDLKEGEKWCLKAAQAGLPEAMVDLASIFGSRIDRRVVTTCGILIGPYDHMSHNDVPFWYWMVKAAKLGETEAIKMLEKETEEITGRHLYKFGHMIYDNGWGLHLKQPDYSVAFECYRRAASKKNSSFAVFAKLRQAYMYLHGLGVERDRLMAKNLCEQILGFPIRNDFEIHIGKTNDGYKDEYIVLPGAYILYQNITLPVRVIIKGDFTVHGNLTQEVFGRYEVQGKTTISEMLSVVGGCQIDGITYWYDDRVEAQKQYRGKLNILPLPPSTRD